MMEFDTKGRQIRFVFDRGFRNGDFIMRILLKKN